MSRHREKRKTLVNQVQQVLDSKLAIGQSKKADKVMYQRDDDGKNICDELGEKMVLQPDLTKEKIYSWSTYKAYLKHNCYFVKWCKDEHSCRKLSDCRAYIDEYLKKLIDDGKSSYTIKLTAQALAKLYNCSVKDFIETPARKRKDIVRSRDVVKYDKHFSEKNNAELINFCKCTGLRRAELKALRGTDLLEKDSKFYLHVHSATKGGRERISPIIGSDEEIKSVVDRMKEVGSGKVFSKIHKAADIHSYRSDYCNRVYKLHARDLKSLSYKEKYYCKKDLAGTCYDREAMKKASEALGHSRVSVIAGHYLRTL